MSPLLTISNFENACALAQQLGLALSSHKLKLTTAESCTGGLVSAAITSVSGSSDWFERGFVTYSNLAKHEMLGISSALIEQQGAVSEAVASEMARGALEHARAEVALSITGIAGPAGGSAGKPVGTVWHGFAFSRAGEAPLKNKAVLQHYTGSREQVRLQAACFALQHLLDLLKP